MFLRTGARGRATGLHFDYPFFTRAHDQVYTVWLPIGDVPVTDGPLVVVEGSNHFRDLIDPMMGFDVARDNSRKATLDQDAVTLAQQRGARLLTRNFEAGDIAVFGMYTLHGSLENYSSVNRVRLSCDVRWQPLSLPLDTRYFGANPGGTTGAGYGELVGAKPLTHEWHVR
jgi:ectoine hydroxylase-related dioxygenase (phytanoyl-CoA dioxygenase family)